MQLTVTRPLINQQIVPPLLVGVIAQAGPENTVEQVTVAVDGGSPVPWIFTPARTVSFSTSRPVTGGGGQHKVTVTAIDDIGQMATKTVLFSLAPDALMHLTIASPLDGQQVVSPFHLDAAATAGVNRIVEHVTVQVDANNPSPVTITPARTVTFTAKGLSASGPGLHHVTVTATDDSGDSVVGIVAFSLAVDTTGQLSFIKVSDQVQQGSDFALFGVLAPDGGGETVLALWLGHASGAPNATAPDWILRAAELAILREALVKKLQVTITHDPIANIATAVKVLAPT